LATDARVHCAVLKQRPTTHHPRYNPEFTGAGTEGSHIRPYLQTPNSVPDTLAASLDVPRSEEQYWKEKTIKCAE
jgi:hypothetical protein